MLLLRSCRTDEFDKIKNILIKEGIEDLVLEGVVYVVLDDNELVGIGKAELIDNKTTLEYLVIREDKRNQELGDALLRAILNKLYNQGINKIYSKSNNSYFLKKGFILNDYNELELNISDFFNKGCNSCGGCK